MKNKYYFSNISAPTNDSLESWKQATDELIAFLKKGYKIISAVATNESVQYILEKKEENNG